MPKKSALLLALFAGGTLVLAQWVREAAVRIEYEGGIYRSFLSLPLDNEAWRIIPGWLELRYAQNTGIAFSFPLEGLALSIVTIALISMIIGYYWRTARHSPSPWTHAGYGLLLGGACSNAYERLFIGHVVDYVWLQRFAIFNLADAAITLGVLILLIIASHERNSDER